MIYFFKSGRTRKRRQALVEFTFVRRLNIDGHTHYRFWVVAQFFKRAAQVLRWTFTFNSAAGYRWKQADAGLFCNTS